MVFIDSVIHSIIGDINHVKLFLSMINTKRFQNNGFWYYVGKLIRMCDTNGLEFWINQSDKAFEGRDLPLFINTSVKHTCENLWFHPISDDLPNLNILPLAFYAREDNPEKYNKWHNQWINDTFKINCKNSEYIMHFAYRLHWLDFAHSDDKWYKFIDGLWGIVDVDDLDLKTNIPKEILNSTKLEFNSRKPSSFREFGDLLFNEKFHYLFWGRYINEIKGTYDKLYVLNGVLERIPNSLNHFSYNISFRDYTPGDFVSIPTDINYEHNLTYINDCLILLRKLFTNDSSFNDFMNIISLSLFGFNKCCLLKSKTQHSIDLIISLLSNIFGEYFIHNPKIYHHPKGQSFDPDKHNIIRGNRILFYNNFIQQKHLSNLVSNRKHCFYDPILKWTQINSTIFLSYLDKFTIKGLDNNINFENYPELNKLCLIELGGNSDINDITPDNISQLSQGLFWLMIDNYRKIHNKRIQFTPINLDDLII